MSQEAKSELLSAAEAAERNFSTNNVVGGGCMECACEVLVRYHYDDGKGIDLFVVVVAFISGRISRLLADVLAFDFHDLAAAGANRLCVVPCRAA